MPVVANVYKATIESCAVAGKPRDAAVNFDRYGVCRQLFFFDTSGNLGNAVAV